MVGMLAVAEGVPVADGRVVGDQAERFPKSHDVANRAVVQLV